MNQAINQPLTQVASTEAELYDEFGAQPAAVPTVSLEGQGFWLRAASYLIDLACMWGATFSAALAVSLLWEVAAAVLDRQVVMVGDSNPFGPLLDFAVLVIYFSLFEWLFGATPGKVIVGMRVVNIDGSACTFSGAVARGFTRIVDGLFFGAVAAINMQKSKNQRWGDKVARTFVVAADTPGIRPERAWWRFVLAAAVCWLLLFLLMSTLFGLA